MNRHIRGHPNIYVPMLTPYIVFLLKNATWFSSKVFPKYCIGNILFFTHNPFVCDLEPVCCKKRPKIVPDQLLVWGIRAL